MFQKYLLTSFLLFCISLPLSAQRIVDLSAIQDQHILTYQELNFLEDSTASLKLADIIAADQAGKFVGNHRSTPQGLNPESHYWYKLKFSAPQNQKNLLLELFDQTIDEYEVYFVNEQAELTHQYILGDNYAYAARPVLHKNFVFPLPEAKGIQEVYVKIKSRQVADVILVIREQSFFIQYAIKEYFNFGLFYGMILIFCLYNLIAYFAFRQLAYLFYAFYTLSIALFELSSDGIAYQYLWPQSILWNQYAFSITLFVASMSTMLFSQHLLLTRKKAPALHRLIYGMMVFRTALFLYAIFWDLSLLNLKYIDFIPLLICYITGCYMLYRGYSPARFYVIGYSFLIFGYAMKICMALGSTWFNFGPYTYYVMSFCFIVEMVFLSLAIGDRLRVLEQKRRKAQKSLIGQLNINQDLKENANQQLKEEVKKRTLEIIEQKNVIQDQYQKLQESNELLQQQQAEIVNMNKLLAQHNQQLKSTVEETTEALVLSVDVDFEAFSQVYQDQDTCNKFLADLKWKQGYRCSKCDHSEYTTGHAAYSRRCKHCDYDESPTVGTILQNAKIPINKAFYLIYLLYTSKGKISSHKLSAILEIRQSTCWAYSKRVKEMMEMKSTKKTNSGAKGWAKLLLMPTK